jgi:rhodanese-related sulfurtransferase
MQKRLLLLTLLGLAASGLWADSSPTAAAMAATVSAKAMTSTASPTLGPTVKSVAATPIPTPKPLYVDYQPPDWAKGWDHITLQQAEKMHKDKRILFLDARAKVEYDEGHIPGALPLPTGETDKYYAMYENEIKHAKKLVTYCHGIGCRLSEKSAKFLVDKGYKNVAVFFGGWPQWNEAKLPVESGDAKAPKSTPVPTLAAAPAAASGTAQALSPAAQAVTGTAAPVSPSAVSAMPVSPAAK